MIRHEPVEFSELSISLRVGVMKCLRDVAGSTRGKGQGIWGGGLRGEWYLSFNMTVLFLLSPPSLPSAGEHDKTRALKGQKEEKEQKPDQPFVPLQGR